ncbi:thermonuclease family protein [Bacillaceae bacterium S4-13-58]
MKLCKKKQNQRQRKKRNLNKKKNPNFISAKVTRIVDGDTIEISINGKEESVRLLLVDTPETKHPSLPVQEYGPEASQFAKTKLLGKQVQLEYDGPKRDKYDRLLGYLWVGGKTFNEMLLEEGLARIAYIYYPPYTHYDAYVKAENRAKSAKKGIWSIDGYVTADGFNSSEPEPEPEPEEPEQPSTGGTYAGPYDPFGPDRDCGDFDTHQDAQDFFIAAGGPDQDPHRLDGSDGDGLACESLP